jgi:hypothetical protein
MGAEQRLSCAPPHRVLSPLRYNLKILHESLRVAVCEVMEETVSPRNVSANGVSPVFAHSRRQLFMMYYDRYLSECERAAAGETNAREGTG